MRTIFPQLCTDNRTPCTRLGIYPLAVTSLSNDQPANQSVVAGGSAYIRFSVPAGSQASIDWSTGGFPVSPLRPVHGGAHALAINVILRPERSEG